MQVNNLKGINLLTEVNVEGTDIKAIYKGDQVLHIPFGRIASTGIYNNVDIAIDMPFDDYLET
jgi:hypothetical protein